MAAKKTKKDKKALPKGETVRARKSVASKAVDTASGNRTSALAHAAGSTSDAVIDTTPDAWYDKAIRVCYYILVALVPAIFTPFFYTAFSFPKLFVLVSVNIMAVLFWGFKVFREGKITLVKSRFNWLLLAFAFVSLLNTFFSVAPNSSIYGSGSRFIGVLTVVHLLVVAFMTFNYFRDVKSIKRLVSISLITSGILGLYGLLQYLGVFDQFLKWNANPADRVFGTIGHGNHFGAYLGMNVLLGVFFFPYLRANANRVLLALSLILMTVVIFLTGSRGALFATAIALMICSLVVIVKKSNYIRTAIRRIPFMITFIFIALLVAAGFISGEIQRSPVVERTIGTVKFIQEGNIPDRLSWWMSTLEMIQQRPVLGYGLSTYRDVYNAFRRTDYVAPGPGDMQDMITPEAAHNEYLNMAATQGLAGLAAFIALVWFVFAGLARITLLTKIPDRNFMLAQGIKGAIFVHLIQVFISFGVISTLSVFYLFLGLGALTVELMRNDYRLPLKTYRTWGALKYFTAAVVLVFCCGYAFMVARVTLSEYFYKEAHVKEAGGDLHGAIADYQRTLLYRPGEYSYYQGFGDFALKNANYPGLTADATMKMLLLAEIQYANAIGINPFHPSIYYNLGLTQIQVYKINGNYRYFQSAKANFETAVKLAVNNPLYPYQAGMALLDSGNEEGKTIAVQYFAEAEKIRPGYRDAAERAGK